MEFSSLSVPLQHCLATTNPDVSLRDLEVGPKIGAGSYGEVFLGRVNRGDYAEDVVVKKYVQKRGLDWKSFYEDELENCRRLQNCPGVASFLGVAGADVYLVWKFQGSVTLETLMDHPDSTIDALAEVLQADSPEAAFQSFTLGLCQALKALHAEGFVHRDIKPGNILLAEQDDGSCTGGRFPVNHLDADGQLMVGYGSGGCADLRNQNFREDEAILDPVYGAPEQFIQKQASGFGALLGGGGVLEATGVPPSVEFDAYSAGLVLLQLGVPSLHSRAAMQMARKALQQCEDQDVAEWREDSTTQDFYNPAVYLIKDIDTTEGSIMLYIYYRTSFNIVEEADVLDRTDLDGVGDEDEDAHVGGLERWMEMITFVHSVEGYGGYKGGAHTALAGGLEMAKGYCGGGGLGEAQVRMGGDTDAEVNGDDGGDLGAGLVRQGSVGEMRTLDPDTMAARSRAW
eukprot:gene1324-1917_t